MVEPVSTAKFPANREKNRDYFKSGAVSRFQALLVQSFLDVRAKFPTHRSREFLGKNREFLETIREFFGNREKFSVVAIGQDKIDVIGADTLESVTVTSGEMRRLKRRKTGLRIIWQLH